MIWKEKAPASQQHVIGGPSHERPLQLFPKKIFEKKNPWFGFAFKFKNFEFILSSSEHLKDCVLEYNYLKGIFC